MEDEYSGVNQVQRSWNTILLPVMGFLLMGASAIIAIVAAEPATDFLRKSLNGIPEGDGVKWAVAFGIFLILMLIFFMFYAILAPKPKAMDKVSERELDKEKKARAREKREQKMRRREINRNMSRENREKNE